MLLKSYQCFVYSRSLPGRASGHQPSGSIGDLMNMKRYYGSSGDVTLETMIARTVPLSTVSPRPSRQLDLHPDCHDFHDFPDYSVFSPRRPSPKIETLPENPTVQQRTQRLSRLISQQRNSSLKSHPIIVSNGGEFNFRIHS
ncbi:Hypothetical protein NTJ_06964 [Nesidiocoris tenuis]|uniref:Uncharacterized protein n=1 Tax=Nesidiocoris tenuis TaxID=355587 RepID=A0ABN7AT96_9HEMI|nr:Hypothetical protein NTJ_06964 [Nesidiocoris tenuis]